MKSVDRPPLNPKRITIESSQECFSVDIPCAAALGECANPSVAGSCPQHRKRPAVRGRPPTYLPQDKDDDDDFMPPKKKPNVSFPTKQHRSSPRLSRPDAPGIKKCVKKVVTKKKKVKASLRQDVLETIAIMNQRQRQAVARKGLSDILDMTLDAIGSRSHLCWLMDKLDPKDMTIRLGPGKELKITKETVRLILGVPCAGGGKPVGVDATAAADRLSWNISNTEVLLTEEMDRFPEIDWCHLIFNGICDGAQAWHQRTTTNTSTTIYGCCIIVLFRSATDTCYASARENHGLRTSPGRAATHHEDTPGCGGPSAPAPKSHAPQPPPSNTKYCHADADDRRHCDRQPTMMKRLNHPMIMIMPHERAMHWFWYLANPRDIVGHAGDGYSRRENLRETTAHAPINDALAAANELMTNLNIAAQGISERTSTRPPADPSLPKFDVLVQDPKAPTAAAPPTSSNQNPCNTGGSEATGDVLQPDNGPVFDETPCGHGSSVPPTTPIASIVKPTRTECTLALREFLCTRDVEIDRTIMDFGGYISTCHDVKESFANGNSLDSVFMQYFIECVRSDDSANLPSSNTSQLILDTNVGAIINIEEFEQHSQNPQTFDLVILQNYLATTLPSHPGLEGIKTIMVPMLRGDHWSLYV
ncbi:hypothetical protein U9M48_013426 [Paspalum notatum var. saurae]|uniref:Ubiquitin-like protease family profile domain-containing protein n=1 Tax=Paspalum notatum var. saurae TaxID=547442 RepID=A0AAQ3SZF8_PASNO